MDDASIPDGLIAKALDPTASCIIGELVEVTLGRDKCLWKWLSIFLELWTHLVDSQFHGPSTHCRGHFTSSLLCLSPPGTNPDPTCHAVTLFIFFRILSQIG